MKNVASQLTVLSPLIKAWQILNQILCKNIIFHCYHSNAKSTMMWRRMWRHCRPMVRHSRRRAVRCSAARSPGVLSVETLCQSKQEALLVSQAAQLGDTQRSQVVVRRPRQQGRRLRVPAQHIVDRKRRQQSQRRSADPGQPATSGHADSGTPAERPEQLHRPRTDPVGMLFGRRSFGL